MARSFVASYSFMFRSLSEAPKAPFVASGAIFRSVRSVRAFRRDENRRARRAMGGAGASRSAFKPHAGGGWCSTGDARAPAAGGEWSLGCQTDRIFGGSKARVLGRRGMMWLGESKKCGEGEMIPCVIYIKDYCRFIFSGPRSGRIMSNLAGAGNSCTDDLTLIELQLERKEDCIQY